MKKHLETLLNRVSKSPLIDNGNLISASELILDAVIEGLTVERSGIWLYDDGLSGIRCYLLKDVAMAVPDEELVLKRSQYPRYFDSLEENRVIAANDAVTAVETSEFAHGYLDVLGITSMLDTPIRHSGKTVGIICTEHRGDAREWSDDEIVFAGVLSDLFGRAISAREKLDYEIQLKEMNKNLETTVLERTQHLHKTINEMRDLQNKLVESEKMAALGNMVSGVAHEVNTPLGVALTAISHIDEHTQKLKKEFDKNAITKSDLFAFIKNISDATEIGVSNLEKAATLITNFKRISADQTHFELQEINVKSYIQQVISHLSPLTNKIGITFTIAGEDIILSTYPGAVAQVITNLVSNSCMHAFSLGFAGKPEICISIQQVDNNLNVIFQDNGKGMHHETIKCMFDPFFTTARNEGGTGLGLSIIHTLVTRKLNGAIDVKSEQGVGTEFTLSLPILNEY